MKFAFQIFVCFGVPLVGVILYAKIFARIEDNLVFQIGLFNTTNYLGWFSIFSTIYFWGLSGLAILGFSYLVCLAPILSIGFSFWLVLHKNELANYRYALFTSISYIVVVMCFFGLIYFKPFR